MLYEILLFKAKIMKKTVFRIKYTESTIINTINKVFLFLTRQLKSVSYLVYVNKKIYNT